MPDNTFTLLIAPILGCFTAISLVAVAYLTSLEISDRRRKRRLAAQLEHLEQSRRYRRPSRYLSSSKPASLLPTSSPRLNLGQAFQKSDRYDGWNFSANSWN